MSRSKELNEPADLPKWAIDPDVWMFLKREGFELSVWDGDDDLRPLIVIRRRRDN